MKRKRVVWFLLVLAMMLMVATAAHADPLDDAQAKLMNFLQKAGLIVSGLIPSAGGVAIAWLAVKRAVAKAAGEEDAMVRSSNQIFEILKLIALGTGASLLVAIAGSILK